MARAIVQNDICKTCRFAKAKPRKHIATPFARRFGCINPQRAQYFLAQAEKALKFNDYLLLSDSAWHLMNIASDRFKKGYFEPLDQITCPFYIPRKSTTPIINNKKGHK